MTHLQHYGLLLELRTTLEDILHEMVIVPEHHISPELESTLNYAHALINDDETLAIFKQHNLMR